MSIFCGAFPVKLIRTQYDLSDVTQLPLKKSFKQWLLDYRYEKEHFVSEMEVIVVSNK